MKFPENFLGVSKSGYFTQTSHFCFMDIHLKLNPFHPFLAICVWHYKPLKNVHKNPYMCTNKSLWIKRNLLQSLFECKWFTHTNHFCLMDIPRKMHPSQPSLAVCAWHHSWKCRKTLICTHMIFKHTKNFSNYHITVE